MPKSVYTGLAIISAFVIILLLSQFGYYPTWAVTLHGLHQLWSKTVSGHFGDEYAGLSWVSLFYSLRLIIAAMILTFAGAILLTIIPLTIKWKPLTAVFDFLAVLFESVPDTIYIILVVALVVYLLEAYAINLPAFNTLSPTWNDTWIPAVTLALPGAFFLRRLLTLQLSDEMGAAYIDTARSKGASASRILYRHVFPNLTSVLIRQIPVVATLILSTILFAEFFMEYQGQMFQFANAVGIDTSSGLTTTPYHSGTVFCIGVILVILWWGFHLISQRVHKHLYPSGIAHTSVFQQAKVQWLWIIIGGAMLLFILVVGFFPRLVTPFTPTSTDTGGLTSVGPPFVPLSPSLTHLFGTDMFGHDILAQTIYGTFETLWPVLVITLLVLILSFSLSALAVTTSARWIAGLLQYVSHTLSAVPAFFILFLVLYHRIDITWMQYVQYIAWFVLIEVGRGSYSSFQMMSQWYQFAFIKGAISVGRSRMRVLVTHLRPWLFRYMLEFSFSEFVRVLSLMAQLAALHVYVTVTIGFLPFRPFRGMKWPQGVISHFPNWLGMIGDSTLSMTYLSYPFFLAAPLLALAITVIGANLIARGIRGVTKQI